MLAVAAFGTSNVVTPREFAKLCDARERCAARAILMLQADDVRKRSDSATEGKSHESFVDDCGTVPELRDCGRLPPPLQDASKIVIEIANAPRMND